MRCANNAYKYIDPKDGFRFNLSSSYFVAMSEMELRLNWSALSDTISQKRQATLPMREFLHFVSITHVLISIILIPCITTYIKDL